MSRTICGIFTATFFGGLVGFFALYDFHSQTAHLSYTALSVFGTLSAMLLGFCVGWVGAGHVIGEAIGHILSKLIAASVTLWAKFF